MSKSTFKSSLYFTVVAFFIQNGQTLCMKRDEKPEKLQPDFVVSTQLAQRLQKHVNMINKTRSDNNEKPQTFEKTMEVLTSLFCSYKFHKGRLAFNDREVEIYDEKKKQWLLVNDSAFQKFHTWFNDAVDRVCDSDLAVGELISLASTQLSTINEESKECYCKLLQHIPKSVAHRIKEEFAWSDPAFLIEPCSIDFEDSIERIKAKKGKLLVGFKDQLCVYDLHDYKLLYSFDKAPLAHCIEKYKKLIAVLHDSGDLALYDKKAKTPGPIWVNKLGVSFNEDWQENSLQFIDGEQIALALKTEIKIINIEDGKTVRSIPMHHEFHLYPQGYIVSNSSTIKYYSYENDQCIVTIDKGRSCTGANSKTKLLFLNDKILIVDSSSILNQFDLLGREAQIVCFDFVYKFQPLDSSLVMIHTYDGLKVIDSASKKCLKRFNHNIYDFAVVDRSGLPEERRLLTHEYWGKKIVVYDLPTFEKVLAARIEKNKSTNQG